MTCAAAGAISAGFVRFCFGWFLCLFCCGFGFASCLLSLLGFLFFLVLSCLLGLLFNFPSVELLLFTRPRPFIRHRGEHDATKINECGVGTLPGSMGFMATTLPHVHSCTRNVHGEERQCPPVHVHAMGLGHAKATSPD